MAKKIIKQSTKDIRTIENNYGLMIFRCAITHLMSVGHQMARKDEFISHSCDVINKNTPKSAFMTADFQCEIVKCAADIAKFDIWEIFSYIKTDLVCE